MKILHSEEGDSERKLTPWRGGELGRDPALMTAQVRALAGTQMFTQIKTLIFTLLLFVPSSGQHIRNVRGILHRDTH